MICPYEVRETREGEVTSNVLIFGGKARNRFDELELPPLGLVLVIRSQPRATAVWAQSFRPFKPFRWLWDIAASMFVRGVRRQPTKRAHIYPQLSRCMEHGPHVHVAVATQCAADARRCIPHSQLYGSFQEIMPLTPSS